MPHPVIIYFCLLVAGVPWWWSNDDTTLLLGVPAWVVGVILVSAIASIYTAIVMRHSWPAENKKKQN
ncbi:MAG: hypothetical protein AAF387_10865 [Pseudomonadota bacterium]